MKRLIAIILCLLFVFLFAACDNGEGKDKDTESNNSLTSSTTSGNNSSTQSQQSAAGQAGGNSASSTVSTGDPAENTSSGKTYVDAETDFTGQVTIVGRWHCLQTYETATGKTTDSSQNGEYYIFESTGKAESYYMDTLMVEYPQYVFTPTRTTERVKEGTLVISYGPTSISLGCMVEENRLTLYTKNTGNQNFQTVYERVPFPQ